MKQLRQFKEMERDSYGRYIFFIECDNTVQAKICANKVYNPAPYGGNSFVIINVVKTFQAFCHCCMKYLAFANV